MHWPCVAHHAKRDKRYRDWAFSEVQFFWSGGELRRREKELLESIGCRVGAPFALWTPWVWGTDPYYAGYQRF